MGTKSNRTALTAFFLKALEHFQNSDDAHEKGFLDESAGTATIVCPVRGTAYEGRNDRIEKIREKEEVFVERAPDNPYDYKALAVRNRDGESLGNLAAEAADYISPFLDAGYGKIVRATVDYVLPLSKRSKKCRNSLLYVALEIRLDQKEALKKTSRNQTLILHFTGDQRDCWEQDVELVTCNMPLYTAKKLFEVFNRYAGEYERLGTEDELYTQYAEDIDGLEEEIQEAREKMKKEMNPSLDYSGVPEYKGGYGYTGEAEGDLGTFMKSIFEKEPERYQDLEEYLPDGHDYSSICDGESLLEIFRSCAVKTKEYYWIDRLRVGSAAWVKRPILMDEHPYEILEAYPASEPLPFDLADKDVSYVFGFHKFAAFADLSADCYDAWGE